MQLDNVSFCESTFPSTVRALHHITYELVSFVCKNYLTATQAPLHAGFCKKFDFPFVKPIQTDTVSEKIV